MYAINQPNSNELYIIQNIKRKLKPTSQLNYELVFKTELDWKNLSRMSRIAVIDSATKIYTSATMFLCLNKLLFKSKQVSSSLYSFCKLEEETTLHFLHECIDMQTLLRRLDSFFNDSFPFPVSTIHSAIFVYVYKH